MLINTDDLINLHKAMVETSSDVSAALSRVLKEAEDRTEQQRSFATALDVFQKKLLQDLEDSSVEANSYLGILVKGIESAFQTATSKVVSFIFDVETDLSGLSQVSNIEDPRPLLESIAKIYKRISRNPTTRLLNSARKLARFSNKFYWGVRNWPPAKQDTGISVALL